MKLPEELIDHLEHEINIGNVDKKVQNLILLIFEENKKHKEVIDKAIDFIEEYNRNRNCFKWNEQDYIDVIDEIYSILKEVYR